MNVINVHSWTTALKRLASCRVVQQRCIYMPLRTKSAGRGQNRGLSAHAKMSHARKGKHMPTRLTKALYHNEQSSGPKRGVDVTGTVRKRGIRRVPGGGHEIRVGCIRIARRVPFRQHINVGRARFRIVMPHQLL